MMSKKRIIFIVVMVALVALGVFFYFKGKIFSKEILKLEILGPDNAKMGEEITYRVKYKNNGNFTLENPKLTFELPDNSLTENTNLRSIQDLEDIYPGDQGIIEFKTRLLGKEGDFKTAHARLSYTPKNLSARYESATSFITKIETVPIALTFDMPTKVEKGKDIDYVINYFSSVDYPLEDLSVKVDSIDGFNIKSSNPKSLDNADWRLATLSKGQGGRISIKGAAAAESGSQLNFGAQLGVWQDGDFIVIKEATQEVEIINPLVSISQQVNGSTNHIASPGENLHYEIFVRNIGSSPVEDLFVTSKLNGLAFDLSTLQSDQGSVKANDGLIVWDSKQVSQLQQVRAQQQVKVTFDVKLKDAWVPAQGAQLSNVVLKNEVKVSDITQVFETKINSNLQISQTAYHSTQQGIENSGPIPPEVDQATTYVINWQVKNYLNDVKNVKVRMQLPTNVSLVDEFWPDNEASHFSFDNASREIVWLAGNLAAGATSTIYFQVSLTPTSDMRGILASLAGQATISGEDQVTGKTLTSFAPGIKTNLPDDSQNSGGGIVK